jgi:hypothetical protein
LTEVGDSAETAAILKRALAYPYATPDRSYLYRDGEAHGLPAGGPDLSGRALPELDEPAILEHVRAHVAPQSSLEDFLRDCVDRGGMKLAAL